VSFDVRINAIGEGEPVPGSAWLHYALNGAVPDSVALTERSPEFYQATLPALSCEDSLSFYVSIEENTIGRVCKPEPEAPFSITPASGEVILFEDDFESDKGWTISGGLWERGIPLGQGGDDLQYPVPDPTEGCNGPQVLGYNLAGDYENNLPETHVTSPSIDCSGMNNVALRFCRWLGVEQPFYDKSSLMVSNNLQDWHLVWEHTATIADLEWLDLEYDVSAVAADQPTVYFRWTMGPTDGGLRYAGWNIDDVQVVSRRCVSWTCGDVDGNGMVNVSDAVYLISYIFGGGPPPDPLETGDVNCDAIVNVSDVVYLIAYIFGGAAGPCDPDGDEVPDC
jgi:hypothetical protein